jgi:hypothetical protein
MLIGLQTVIFTLIIAWFQGISHKQPVPVPPGPPPIVNPPQPGPPTPAPPVPPAPAREPGDGVPWVEYKTKQNTTNAGWGKVLTDIQQHLDPKHGNTYFSNDHITHGHETTHGINSDIRNNLGKRGQNGFYCLEGRAMLLYEPSLRIRQVAPLVPQSVRGGRYQLYLVQQAGQWDDMPTYIFDEWVAYINGTTVGIDQIKNNLKGRGSGSTSDDAIAPMEFTYYALALCRAVKQHDTNYFKANPEFSEFVSFNVRRSALAFREAIQMKEFQWETKLIDNFISSADAQPLRDIAVELWGEAFCKKYLFTK